MDYSGQPEEYVKAVIYGIEGVYDNAMVIFLDPNKKVIDFYEVMKNNGDIDKSTQFKIEDFIDISIYEDALKTMIERGGNSTLFQSLMEEFKQNNME
ncbi:hypothetical protein AZF37_03465 [endosymbiont 'TC1' of Trimyema compressum]|uniref:hypothetical protein n=1 Tax=endosymbiont 'TC1' of Trimyema compressum TaxID=243899 RepID=UPI0007F14C37|nr:hypothetical protein [endosymbiont 'TC1' of Trimyema compressum]AMP20353.1 hypothetical protein AZF37_03465 [endosymbiont 'TC1' of Trimyema compressum]